MLEELTDRLADLLMFLSLVIALLIAVGSLSVIVAVVVLALTGNLP